VGRGAEAADGVVRRVLERAALEHRAARGRGGLRDGREALRELIRAGLRDEALDQVHPQVVEEVRAAVAEVEAAASELAAQLQGSARLPALARQDLIERLSRLGCLEPSLLC
jgi:hypothetical protein